MKCEECGYIEEVEMDTIKLLRELQIARYGKPDEDHMLCPFCIGMMYRLDSPRFRKPLL